MKRSRRNELGVGLLVTAGLVAAVFMAVQAGGLSSGAGYTVSAVFDDASGLVDDAAVTLAGVKIGTVSRIVSEDGKAAIFMNLERESRVPVSCLAEVRARSLLGEKYVSLVADSGYQAPWLEDGARIERTRIPMEIDQLVTRIGPMLDGLDAEQLNALLQGAQELLGSEDAEGRSLAQRMNGIIDDVSVLTAELRGRVPATMSKLDRSVDRLPPTLDRLDATLGDARELLAQLKAGTEPVPELVERVDRILTELEPAAADLRSAAGDTDELLDRIDRLAAGLEGIDRHFILELFREQGMLIRVRAKEVPEPAPEGSTAP